MPNPQHHQAIELTEAQRRMMESIPLNRPATPITYRAFHLTPEQRAGADPLQPRTLHQLPLCISCGARHQVDEHGALPCGH
jgi:hypothetical protein